jgi:folate-binding protein YgfZ
MTSDKQNISRIATPGVSVVGSHDIEPYLADAVRFGALVAPASDVAVIKVTGPGAVDCMQGLLTNDLESPGDNAFIYAALLTHKGMIVSDMWVARQASDLTLFAPHAGVHALTTALERSLPPRLARFEDASGLRHVLRLVGPGSPDVVARANLPETGPGQLVERDGVVIARPSDDGPFTVQIEGPQRDEPRLLKTLATAGAEVGAQPTLELARILRGWPRLGAEIDTKTLPQEVRYDEIGGLSYSKGCYVGQETVARLHFRGHTNKRLVGLLWDAPPNPNAREVSLDGTNVGRVSSLASLDHSNLHVGIAMIRREVDVGTSVLAGGLKARTVELPFQFER